LIIFSYPLLISAEVKKLQYSAVFLVLDRFLFNAVSRLKTKYPEFLFGQLAADKVNFSLNRQVFAGPSIN